MKSIHIIGTFILAGGLCVQAASVRLDELDLKTMSSGWGTPRKNRAITDKPLTIGAQTFAHGVGTHANSEYWLRLDGQAQSISAKVGVDAAATSDKASVEFQVEGDGRLLWSSGVCKRGEAPRECRVNLAGITNFALLVSDAGDGTNSDHANWADTTFIYSGQPPKPEAGETPSEERVMLTPPAPPEPRINGPKVYGARPGSPFLYRIPCTGMRPITFSARNLLPA